MSYTRVFIHGLESTSQGTKGVFFRTRYPDMILDDFTGPLESRMNKLTDLLSHKDSLILVGSSYGGLMAAMFAARFPERVRKMILLAPALILPEFEPYRSHRLDMPVTLYHGMADDIISPAQVRIIAEECYRNLTYHLVDDDHTLMRVFTGIPWDDLLQSQRAEKPIKSLTSP
jgi:predicted esterase